jgi:hypothetical protein
MLPSHLQVDYKPKECKAMKIMKQYPEIGLVLMILMCVVGIAIISVFFVRQINADTRRAIKQADEQTARIWPEDRYGEIESFFDVMDHGEGEDDPLNEWRETIAKAEGR